MPALRESLELLTRWRTLHAFLYEYSNFGRLPAPALRALMAEFKPLSVRKGELIVREGDAAGPMYLLRSGRVGLQRCARATRTPRLLSRGRVLWRAGDAQRGTASGDRRSRQRLRTAAAGSGIGRQCCASAIQNSINCCAS